MADSLSQDEYTLSNQIMIQPGLVVAVCSKAFGLRLKLLFFLT